MLIISTENAPILANFSWRKPAATELHYPACWVIRNIGGFFQGEASVFTLMDSFLNVQKSLV